jgi:hypothetical protein
MNERALEKSLQSFQRLWPWRRLDGLQEPENRLFIWRQRRMNEFEFNKWFTRRMLDPVNLQKAILAMTRDVIQGYRQKLEPRKDIFDDLCDILDDLDAMGNNNRRIEACYYLIGACKNAAAIWGRA